MKKNNKKLKFISLILLIIFCLYFQTVAYSAISSKLMITGDAVARIRNNVRINNFKIHEVSDGVISSYEEFSKTYTMSNVTLPNSDSYIIYELVIGNYEDVEMQLSSITGLPSNLTYELIDYNLHDMICDNTNKCFGGVEKTFYIKIKYATYNALGTNYNINLEYEFKEFSNTLMIGSSFNATIPSTATHLVFTDEKPAAGTALTDLSAEQDMGVVGYLDGTTYKVSTRRTGVMPEANADSSYMFNGSKLQNISFKNLKTDGLTTIAYMFQDCSNLINIDFATINTLKINEMRSVFKNCTSLVSVDLSNFVTNDVISFSEMFMNCSSLVNLDVSHFNVSRATSFRAMFSGCASLKEIDVSSWVITKAGCSLSKFFYDCSSLETVNANNLVNNNVGNIELMFYNNVLLTNLYINNWDTSSVKSLNSVFKFNRSLTSLNLSNWNVGNVTSSTWVFEDCINMKYLNLSGWKFEKCTDLSGMFHGMTNLEEIIVDNWDTSTVTTMYRLFVNNYKLTSLDLSSWDTSNVTNMSYMFNNDRNIEKIYVGSGWDTSNVTNSVDMFFYCLKLPNFDSSLKDISKAYVGEGGYLSRLSNVSIGGVSYQYEEGMTWRDWVDSSYDTRGFVNNNDLIYTDDLMYALVYEEDNGSYTSYSWPYIDDLIDPNLVYVTFYEAGEDGEW